MRPRVFCNSFGGVVQSQTPIQYTAAEIHIFEPEREKALVQSTQFLPHGAANHQERSGWLLHLKIPGVVQPQTTVSPVDRISRPDSIKHESFQNKDGRCGQAP